MQSTYLLECYQSMHFWGNFKKKRKDISDHVQYIMSQGTQWNHQIMYQNSMYYTIARVLLQIRACLLLWVRVYSEATLCLIVCDPMECSLPDSSVHGISQARVLEWVANSFSSESSRPGIKHVSPALVGGFFIAEPPGKPSCYWAVSQMLSFPFTL